jgi:hypothetical protein
VRAATERRGGGRGNPEDKSMARLSTDTRRTILLVTTALAVC